MLALQSSRQSSGFSVMDADELFFINGGSSEGGNNNSDNKINDNSPEYKLGLNLEGEIEFDESTGNPKGSASGGVSYSVYQGKKYWIP